MKKIIFYPSLINPFAILLSILFSISYIFIVKSFKTYLRFVLERIIYLSLNTFLLKKEKSNNISIYLSFIILPSVKRKSFAYKRKCNSLYKTI